MVSYNFELIPEKKIGALNLDRGFQYGDGLFETMICENGQILFLEDHLERLRKGLKALRITPPKSLNKETIISEVRSLAEADGLGDHIRVKLTTWRKEGGLYTPISNEANVMITVKPVQQQTDENYFIKTDFCETSTVAYSAVSFCKTLSSMSYVLAGIEKKEKEVDDLIICNTEGYVAEFISSNIFWIKDDKVYTPKLETGCVAGISRKNIIKVLENHGYKVKKVLARKYDLTYADVILSTNIAGVKIVKELEGRTYNSPRAWRTLFLKAYDL
ncbi:aminotransferase class IV [Sediminitomix flava]|uniref:branched-chain-amino-acid transaminase n=1 Tax=Sediminitomix flava TaxID=379075 RepID=A0A315Z5P3_SEDFL|nr:aminotransferase class IV [Sediminitomix flava]PWJ38597.1 branched-chain amino acid aminotransferase [Sediminitomix flava]